MIFLAIGLALSTIGGLYLLVVFSQTKEKLSKIVKISKLIIVIELSLSIFLIILYIVDMTNILNSNGNP